MRSTKTVDLHCTCRMPEEKGDDMAECDSCHVSWTFPVRCLVRRTYTGNVKLMLL